MMSMSGKNGTSGKGRASSARPCGKGNRSHSTSGKGKGGQSFATAGNLVPWIPSGLPGPWGAPACPPGPWGAAGGMPAPWGAPGNQPAPWGAPGNQPALWGAAGSPPGTWGNSGSKKDKGQGKSGFVYCPPQLKQVLNLLKFCDEKLFQDLTNNVEEIQHRVSDLGDMTRIQQREQLNKIYVRALEALMHQAIDDPSGNRWQRDQGNESTVGTGSASGDADAGESTEDGNVDDVS